MNFVRPVSFQNNPGFHIHKATLPGQRNFEIFKVSPLALRLPPGRDPQEGKNFVICGGLGDVTSRYLAPGFVRNQEIFPNDKFIIVDLPDPADPAEAAAIREKIQSLNLPMVAEKPYLPAAAFYEAVTRARNREIRIGNFTTKIDGVILALPPDQHFPIARLLTDNGFLVGVEKPLAHPDHLEAILQLAETHPNKIYPIDYMLNSDSYNFMLAENLLGQIGTLREIAGRIVEKPPYNPARRWLLQPNISGGGAGMDIHPHLIAAISALFGELSSASVARVLAGRYQIEAMPPGPGETYLWLKLLVGGNLPVLLECGVGVADNYEGLTFTGTEGTVEIFNGIDTEAVPPFIRHTSAEKQIIYVFPGGDPGYGHIWLNFEYLARGADIVSGLDLATILRATATGVKSVRNAYQWLQDKLVVQYAVGQTPTVPKKVAGRVDPQVNALVKNLPS